MQYTFNRDGKPEKVIKERWCWEATYKDGTVLKQFGDDGIFHQFKEINLDNLHVFKMVSDDNPQVFTIIYNPANMKLIHFYRNFMLNVGSEEAQKVKFYVFGYETKVMGRNSQHLMIITPQDELVMTDDLTNLAVA